jgi:hypothetical protein
VNRDAKRPVDWVLKPNTAYYQPRGVERSIRLRVFWRMLFIRRRCPRSSRRTMVIGGDLVTVPSMDEVHDPWRGSKDARVQVHWVPQQKLPPQ